MAIISIALEKPPLPTIGTVILHKRDRDYNRPDLLRREGALGHEMWRIWSLRNSARTIRSTALSQVEKSKVRYEGLCMLVALAACSTSPPSCKRVALEEYSNLHRCWLDEDGDINGYVALTPAATGSVPTFISRNCLISDKEVGVLNYYFENPIRIQVGSTPPPGAEGLQRKIINNLVLPRLGPLPTDPVFMFKGRLTEVGEGEARRYIISDYIQWTTMPFNFETLIAKLNEPAERAHGDCSI